MIIIDIDECTEGTHNCIFKRNCENTKGSYICHCGQRYRRPAWDAKRCEGKPHHNIIVSIEKYFLKDIDECAERLDGCQQNCTNKIGYFICSCFEGYTTNILNLRKCDGIMSSTCIMYKCIV